MPNKDDIHTVTKFKQLLEVVTSDDFAKYKDLNLDDDVSDNDYNSIVLDGDLKKYNTKQLMALRNYAKKQLPNVSDYEIDLFMSKSLTNPKTHKILRQHIAYHNPDLFKYINK